MSTPITDKDLNNWLASGTPEPSRASLVARIRVDRVKLALATKTLKEDMECDCAWWRKTTNGECPRCETLTLMGATP